jgi:hypothetical protein
MLPEFDYWFPIAIASWEVSFAAKQPIAEMLGGLWLELLFQECFLGGIQK